MPALTDTVAGIERSPARPDARVPPRNTNSDSRLPVIGVDIHERDTG